MRPWNEAIARDHFVNVSGVEGLGNSQSNVLHRYCSEIGIRKGTVRR